MQTFKRYFIALLITGAAAAVGFACYPRLQNGPALILILAVGGAAWLGGIGPGLLVAFLSVVLLNFLFVVPQNPGQDLTASGSVELMVFAAVAVATAKLVAWRRRAENELRRTNLELEDRIGQRTAELAAVNQSLQREINERLRAEDDLRRSNADLEKFAYIASHDLQEPLRTIQGYSDLLRDRYRDRLDTNGQQFLDFIHGGAGRLRSQISALLSYSRAGSTQMQTQRIDLTAVVSQAQAACKAAIEETGAVIHQGPLPEIDGDSTLLSLVFQNLITNAIKFRSADRRPEIAVAARQTDGKWEFMVSDNGIGIDSQHLSSIFTVFRRLHTQEEYSGAGIGLAIAKRIIERHGGNIWAESEKGRGSTFHFLIPERASPAGENPA